MNFEKKDFILYALILLVGALVLIGLVSSLRSSKKWKAALEEIQNAKGLVSDTKDLLMKQGLVIDSIKRTNNNINGYLNDIKTQTDDFRKTMIYKFNQADFLLDSVQTYINRLKPRVGPS